MVIRLNFKALVWTLAPIWTLLVAGIWLHLQQVQFYSASIFQNSLYVTGITNHDPTNTTICQGVTACWTKMCQLAGTPNVSWVGLQIPTLSLSACNSGIIQSQIQDYNTTLFPSSNLLAILAIFVELVNIAIAGISLGLPFRIFDWARYVLTAGSLLLMEAAYILEILIRIQLRSIQSNDDFEWSLILDGMLMVTLLMSSIGSTIARISVQRASEEYKFYTQIGP